MQTNILGNLRKAKDLLETTVEWNLTASDGKLARLSSGDIQNALKDIRKANALIDRAEIALVAQATVAAEKEKPCSRQ